MKERDRTNMQLESELEEVHPGVFVLQLNGKQGSRTWTLNCNDVWDNDYNYSGCSLGPGGTSAGKCPCGLQE